MKESKRQHRTRVIETTSLNTASVSYAEKEHWPVGPLPDDIKYHIDADATIEENELYQKEQKRNKDNDLDQESVSWP
jgi:hypothetical protein